MKIKNVTITNFRGIRSFSYDCSSSLNVFAGVNGAGKSTVLCAVNILLGWLISRLRNAKGRGYNLLDADITRDCDYCLLQIEVLYSNSSLKIEIKAKRLFVASQRVL